MGLGNLNPGCKCCGPGPDPGEPCTAFSPTHVDLQLTGCADFRYGSGERGLSPTPNACIYKSGGVQGIEHFCVTIDGIDYYIKGVEVIVAIKSSDSSPAVAGGVTVFFRTSGSFDPVTHTNRSEFEKENWGIGAFTKISEVNDVPGGGNAISLAITQVL